GPRSRARRLLRRRRGPRSSPHGRPRDRDRRAECDRAGLRTLRPARPVLLLQRVIREAARPPRVRDAPAARARARFSSGNTLTAKVDEAEGAVGLRASSLELLLQGESVASL